MSELLACYGGDTEVIAQIMYGVTLRSTPSREGDTETERNTNGTITDFNPLPLARETLQI